MKVKYQSRKGNKTNDKSLYMIEDYMIDMTLPRRERLCVALQLAGDTTKITAAQQRQLIGYPVFGQKNVGISEEGKIDIAMQVAFGHDCLSGSFEVDKIIALADKKEKFNW